MDSVQEVKSRLDIVDIVGEYLQLKPSGSGSFKACCPFHQEKTPSFMVNRPRQSWHCFGCNIGGDMISFIEKIEGMEFMEALELLAGKAGVTLPKFNKEQMGEKKSLQEANEYICKLLQHNLLTSPEAKIARDYIQARGIDDLTADIWRLGYAPADWSNLQQKIKEQNITAADLIKIGIASPKENNQGIYYRFRSRLMFPIQDAFGHVIGFTGRILTDEKVAKYINTPETVLYKKSHVLYGLDKAKADIKRQDMAIIVEGNMDALTSHQFDVKNVVASSGTALTPEQLNLIKRFTTNIAIAFDMDAAGLEATLRGMDLARQMELNIKVIRYDQNIAKDPDELIRKDLDHWKESIRNSKPLMEWVYQHAFEQFDESTPDGKKQIAQFILNECRHIPHPVERDAWIFKLAKDLDIAPDALRSALSKTFTKSASSMSSNPKNDKKTEPDELKIEDDAVNTAKQIEERWLAAVLMDPKLFHELDIVWKYPPHTRLYNYLNTKYNSSVLSQIPEDAEIQSLIDFLAIVADKEFSELDKSGISAEFTNTENRLLQLSDKLTRETLEQQMREAERKGDTARIQELITQFQNLKT
jgi:DNA primase